MKVSKIIIIVYYDKRNEMSFCRLHARAYVKET